MLKTTDYRKHADECRALAQTFPDGAQRQSLVEMADVWDRLAAERSVLLDKHPELRREHE